MSDLASKKCVSCEGLTEPMGIEEIKENLAELQKKEEGYHPWKVEENHYPVKNIHLFKRFKFPDFVKSLELVNKIAKLAEKEGHHPLISFTWGYVEVRIWTHAIKGLSMNDFILAAKIDTI